MAATPPPDSEAFRRFLRQVWQHDITPLLAGPRADQRRKSAQIVGRIAATTGLMMDGLLRLKGKPFARSLTVLGSSLGAMLPDAWDWGWLRERADRRQQEVVEQQVVRRAGEMFLDDALALFSLTPTASREQLKHAWREFSQRWHPDKAPDDRRRAEYHVRFIAHKTAYERLCAAYDAGELGTKAS